MPCDLGVHTSSTLEGFSLLLDPGLMAVPYSSVAPPTSSSARSVRLSLPSYVEDTGRRENLPEAETLTFLAWLLEFGQRLVQNVCCMCQQKTPAPKNKASLSCRRDTGGVVYLSGCRRLRRSFNVDCRRSCMDCLGWWLWQMTS